MKICILNSTTNVVENICEVEDINNVPSFLIGEGQVLATDHTGEMNDIWNGSSYEIGGTNYYCVIFNSKEQLHTYNYVQGHPIYGTMGNEVRVPENYG